jgi:hypothetical protein
VLAGAALVPALWPVVAAACASCVASAYGDRSFNWGYFGLLLLPFALTAVIGGVIAWSAGVRPRSLSVAVGARLAALRPPRLPHKETT